MEYQVNYISPEIKLSCYEGRLFKTEAAFDDHLLVWLISGETRIMQADGSFVFGAGSTFLIPRIQPATILNYPKDGLPHKAVAMHLSQQRLREFFNTVQPLTAASTVSGIRSFATHPLLESCLASLIPYFEMQHDFPENIASLKINEAVNILRTIDPTVDRLLHNFGEPGKLNLPEFMERNFMFNMPLERFAYLTGRGLTTFKRDFQRAFGSTPQRWLTRKRLELAHYRLSQQHIKPAEVYLQVGFENLSHFSAAFKKEFGMTPTQLRNNRSEILSL